MLQDRENDFAQEMFVSPISRYSIVVGKIIGETLVALPQAAALWCSPCSCGIDFTLSSARRSAADGRCRVFAGRLVRAVDPVQYQQPAGGQPGLPVPAAAAILPGRGVHPDQALPWFLDLLSRLAPLRYAVDLVRGVFYAGEPDYSLVVLDPVAFNLLVCAAMFSAFLVVGTFLFVRRERNR